MAARELLACLFSRRHPGNIQNSGHAKIMSKLLPKYGYLPPDYKVPDVLEQGMTLVFCGTALGQQSAEAKAYYANPGNFFWRALHETGITAHRFKPQQYEQLRTLGIGLTDLCKIAFGNDHELPADALDGAALHQKIQQYQPDILAFTSKAGASAYLNKPPSKMAYGFTGEQIGNTRICILTSPSGQARRFWQPQVWQELADKYQLLHSQKNL